MIFNWNKSGVVVVEDSVDGVRYAPARLKVLDVFSEFNVLGVGQSDIVVKLNSIPVITLTGNNALTMPDLFYKPIRFPVVQPGVKCVFTDALNRFYVAAGVLYKTDLTGTIINQTPLIDQAHPSSGNNILEHPDGNLIVSTDVNIEIYNKNLVYQRHVNVGDVTLIALDPITFDIVVSSYTRQQRTKIYRYIDLIPLADFLYSLDHHSISVSEAKIYYAQTDGIKRINKDGTGYEFYMPAIGLEWVAAVYYFAGKLYIISMTEAASNIWLLRVLDERTKTILFGEMLGYSPAADNHLYFQHARSANKLSLSMGNFSFDLITHIFEQQMTLSSLYPLTIDKGSKLSIDVTEAGIGTESLSAAIYTRPENLYES